MAAQFDDLRKVRHGGQEDRHLDHVAQARAGGPQHAVEVLEGLLGLAVEVALADDLAVVADRGLAGDEHEVAELDGLGQQEGGVGVGLRVDLLGLELHDRCL
ncbi:hypothetical protein D3C72_1900600 [compost metagenome]